MEFNIYNILCVEEKIKAQKDIREHFKNMKNIRMNFCRGDEDCRFILKSLMVDLIIANLDNVKCNSLDYVRSIERHASFPPPVIFYSKNKEWINNFKLYQFSCCYFLHQPLSEEKILSVVTKLLPGSQEEGSDNLAHKLRLAG